jgi:hypothetical protein
MAAAFRLPPGAPGRREPLLGYFRAVYAAVNRGDIGAAADLIVPDYELHIAADGLGPGAGMARRGPRAPLLGLGQRAARRRRGAVSGYRLTDAIPASS